MGIRVYNTLSRTKEPFEPLRPPAVGMYLCGPTVYRPSHIGHLVGPVLFDAVKRYLTYCGYQVTWVVNITDVDDKLIKESGQRQMSMAELAAEMTADYMANLKALGIDTIDHFPKATAHMADIIAFTQRLIDKGFAYESDGDVYFDVARDAEYGKLSGRSVESMVGEGGETAHRKHSAADFALWKRAKTGEPSWPSPWGPGRPGWHIECSAMSHKLLGDSFDIHGGGLDLVFPHHENEVAQSECCHGKPQAKYWMHNGLMQAADQIGKLGGRDTRPIDGDQHAQEAGKIGKSKGAESFRDLLQRHAPETIRFFLLSTHYRRPIYFSEERLAEIATSLDTFYRYIKRYDRVAGKRFYALQPPARRGDPPPLGEGEAAARIVELRARFLEAMDDDFNTGGAIGELFELVRALNRLIDVEDLENAKSARTNALATLDGGTLVLRELTHVLGLFRLPPAAAPQSADDKLVDDLLHLLIDLRAEARASKNFALADRIRKSLGDMGVALEDRAGSTDWIIKR